MLNSVGFMPNADRIASRLPKKLKTKVRRLADSTGLDESTLLRFALWQLTEKYSATALLDTYVRAKAWKEVK